MQHWKHLFAALFLTAAISTAKPPSNPKLDNSEVYIPWQEFRQIIDRLSQPDTIVNDTIHAPTDYVLTSAEISGSVIDNSAARFIVQLDLTVLPSRSLKENGWVTVKLGQINSQAVLEAVTVKAEVLPLHTKSSEYQLLFSKAGRYPLKLVYHCAVTSNEGTHSINLLLPKTLAADLDFTLTDTRADITVNGTMVPVEKIGKGVRIRTPLSTSNVVSINYTPLGGIQESGEDTTRITPRVYAATGLLADIRENQIQYQYRIDYQIWHKKITSFTIALPDTYAIEEVEGAGIAQWKLERGQGKPVLSVTTNFTPEKKYSLTIRFSRKLENMANRIPVPSLQVLNVNRENGCLAIVSQQTMEVSIADSLSGLTAVDQSELHPWMQSRQDLLMRFKYIHTPYYISLDVKRHSDMPVLVAIADDVTFTTLLTEEGYILSQFRYHIRNNHKQYLRVRMPGGWQLWSALIDGGPVMPATSGEAEVLIPLKKMGSNDNGEGFRLELVYWREWKKMGYRGTFSFTMPDIDINVQSINGDLWVPNKFRYSGFKGNLKKTALSLQTPYQTKADSWSTVNMSQRQSRRFGKMANQQMTNLRKGLSLTLPVEISVPTEGTHFHFAKKLTISGEKADLALLFRKRLPDIGKSLGQFFPIVFFLIGFICIRISLVQRKRKRILITCTAGLIIMLMLIIVQNLFYNSLHGIAMFFWGIVSGVVAHCAYSLKHSTASSTGIALLLFVFILTSPVYSKNNDTDLTSSTVAVPWSDFKQILDRIRKPQIRDTVTPVAPPVAYVIGAADYRGELLDARQCLFTATLNITVLEKWSWVEIKLVQGVAVFPDVKVFTPPGGTAAIGTDASGNNALIVKGTGSYTVTFRFSAAIIEQSGVSTVRFPMPYQTATSIRLALDKPDYRVTANNIPLTPHVTGPDRSLYEGAIGRNSTATISWRQEITQISAQDAMLLGQVNTFYSIGLGLIQMTSEINLSIIHQAIREFTFSLPRSVTVVDMTGPAVLTWEKIDTTGTNKPQIIRVLFKYSIKNRASFELTAEQSYSDSISALLLPDLNLGNASRQEGFIAVGVTSNIELMQKDLSANILRKDRRELPPWFENTDDILFSYQYLSGSYKINFDINRHENISGLAALVEREDTRSVIREDGKTITEITMKVVNRGEQFLRINWTPSRQLWSLYCNNRPARPAFDSATSELLVPLKKTAEQSTVTRVRFVYLEQNQGFNLAGKHSLVIPEVNMPAQNVKAVIYVPSSIDMVYTSGNLHPTESEKRQRTRWFTSVFGMIRNLFTIHHKDEVVVDSFKEIPQEQLSRISEEAPSIAENTYTKDALNDKKKIAPASRRRKPDDGNARSPAIRKGVLGVATGQAQRENIDSDEILFGEGGLTEDLDGVLKSQKGLNEVRKERRSVAGIGYGAGYSTGLAESTTEQQMYLPPSSSVESGQLSLPINVTFDGISHLFSTALLKSRESPELIFLYRKVSTRTPIGLHLLLFIFTLISGAVLTVCLWSGWSVRKVLFGIVVPFTAALMLSRMLGITLNIDCVVLLPVLFFLWKAGIYSIGFITSRIRQRSINLTDVNYIDGEIPNSETSSPSADNDHPDNEPPVMEGGH